MSRPEPPSHLSSRARTYLGKPAEERKAEIERPRYIPTKDGDSVLEDWERLLKDSLNRKRYDVKQIRPEGRLLAAETGMGKSTVVWMFAQKHRPRDMGELDVMEVVALEVREPGAVPFLNQLISKFDPKGFLTGNAEYKMKRALHYISTNGVAMIIVDEFHNMLEGSQRQLEETCNLMKTLANKFGIPIVVVGTERVENVFAFDRQLLSRFRQTHTLNRVVSPEDLKSFLRPYERSLPLKRPSHLDGDEKAELLLDRSGGVLGEVVLCVQTCAKWAIDDGSESVTVEHLKRFKFTSVRPSQL